MQPIVCPDCKGTKVYQPLTGPAEPCAACGGTGATGYRNTWGDGGEPKPLEDVLRAAAREIKAGDELPIDYADPAVQQIGRDVAAGQGKLTAIAGSECIADGRVWKLNERQDYDQPEGRGITDPAGEQWRFLQQKLAATGVELRIVPDGMGLMFHAWKGYDRNYHRIECLPWVSLQQAKDPYAMIVGVGKRATDHVFRALGG